MIGAAAADAVAEAVTEARASAGEAPLLPRRETLEEGAPGRVEGVGVFEPTTGSIHQ